MPKTKTEKMSPKKMVYIILTILLGSILGCLAYGLGSIACTKTGPLPAPLFWILILTGAVSGYFLGFRWWRIVYIEHRHWRNWRKKKRHN